MDKKIVPGKCWAAVYDAGHALKVSPYTEITRRAMIDLMEESTGKSWKQLKAEGFRIVRCNITPSNAK